MSVRKKKRMYFFRLHVHRKRGFFSGIRTIIKNYLILFALYEEGRLTNFLRPSQKRYFQSLLNSLNIKPVFRRSAIIALKRMQQKQRTEFLFLFKYEINRHNLKFLAVGFFGPADYSHRSFIFLRKIAKV